MLSRSVPVVKSTGGMVKRSEDTVSSFPLTESEEISQKAMSMFQFTGSRMIPIAIPILSLSKNCKLIPHSSGESLRCLSAGLAQLVEHRICNPEVAGS